MASDRQLSGDSSVTKVQSPQSSPSKSNRGSPFKASPLQRTTSIKLARQEGTQQPSKASQAAAAPVRRRSLSRDGMVSSNRALSARNLNGAGPPRRSGLTRSGSNSQLSTSLHSSSAPRRTRSGELTAMAPTRARTTRNRDSLSTSNHSVQSRGGRPLRDRSLDRSLSSNKSLGSQRSSLSRESVGSRKSLDNSNHHQDMQERIKQRAALRAAGISSRSLRSMNSDEGSSQPSLTRKSSAEAPKSGASLPVRKPPQRSSSAEGSTLFNRRPLGAIVNFSAF